MASKKTLEDLRSHLSSFKDDSAGMRKGYVLWLFSETNSNVKQTLEQLITTLPADIQLSVNKIALRLALTRLVSVLKTKKKSLTESWPSLIRLLLEPFPVPQLSSVGKEPPAEPSQSASAEPSGSAPVAHSTPSTPVTPPESSHKASTPVHPRPTTVSPNLSPVRSPPRKRLKKDCSGCVTKRMANENLRKTNERLRQKQRELATAYRTSLSAFSPGRVGQALKRKDQSISSWKAKYFSARQVRDTGMRMQQRNVSAEAALLAQKKLNSELNDKLEALTKANIRLSAELDALQKKYLELKQSAKDTQKHASSQLKALEKTTTKERQALIVVHQNELLQLQEEMAEALDTKKVITTKSDKKQYGCKLRKCLYKCLLSQVSVQYCSSLLAYLGRELFNRTLSHLPDKTVVAQMAYELGVLADIQTGYVLHNASTVTLAWDATSLKGGHINEVHIHTKDQALTLNIGQLPGGKSEDYAGHILASITDIISAYCGAFGQSEVDVKSHIVDAVKSTLSDRACVNHCVVELLKESLDTDLIELNCNVHPLDGLAHAAREALNTLDKDWGIQSQAFKSCGCTLANLIHCISKMRYKQGTGDPGGFLTFLRENNLKPGVILRYVGNRLHVMFHMAAVLFFHLQTLLHYFKMKCSRTNSMRTAILHDMQQTGIQAQMQAVGLFAKLVTGPWMTVMYKNERKRTHLEVVSDGIFTTCLEFLKGLTESPASALNSTKDAFGFPLETSAMTTYLQQMPASSIQQERLLEAIQALSSAFIKKLNGQLQRYISGPLSQPTPQMLSDTASAPLHNMQSERTLGMMDALWRRSPNATLGFVDGKVKGRQNYTLEWLQGFAEEEQERLVHFAVARGAKIRAVRAQRTKQIEAALVQRQAEVSQKRDMKNRRKVESQIQEAMENKSLSAQLEAFNCCDNEQLRRLDAFIRDPASHVGTVLSHVWFEDGSDVVFFERIRSIKEKRKEQCITLTYWKAGTTPEGRADYNLTLVKFLADVALGDVKFL